MENNTIFMVKKFDRHYLNQVVNVNINNTNKKANIRFIINSLVAIRFLIYFITLKS